MLLRLRVSTGLHGLACLRHQVELAEEKEDAGAEVGEVAEPAGSGLELLDARIEAFGKRVGDPVREVVEQPGEVHFKRARGPFQRRQPRADGSGIPFPEMHGALCAAGAVPKVFEVETVAISPPSAPSAEYWSVLLFSARCRSGG